MNYSRITIITPPDKIFNSNCGYLLVNPSIHTKEQFQSVLECIDDDLSVFIFDKGETDIDWLLSVTQSVDTVLIDVDNCDEVTKQFVSVILAMHPGSYYMTLDDSVPYNLLTKNRIYNFDSIIQQALSKPQSDSNE